MFFKKPLNVFLLPVISILVSFFLLSILFVAGQNILETFSVAKIAALNNLKPHPMNYFWELNIHQAALDKNKIHIYADYYEHLLQALPFLWEANGVLGYCYHYLNDDPKAIKFLKIAIQNYPEYFWNYYNLAVIYINESRYQEASDLLQKALSMDPMTSEKRMLASQWVYAPLLIGDKKEVFEDSALHFKEVSKACLILIQILDRLKDKKDAQGLMRGFNLELYAF